LAAFEDGLPWIDFANRKLQYKTPSMAGTDVKVLQTLLNQCPIGAAPNPPLLTDGVFGPITSEAVRRFQSYFQIAPDGIVGPQTFYYLGEATKGYLKLKPQFGSRTLAMGSSGGDVWVLQNRLSGNGRSCALTIGRPADGYFDRRTYEAVRMFQRNVQGLDPGVPINGEVCHQTYNALEIFTNFGGRTLKKGTRGYDVYHLQYVLRGLGIYRGKLDGIFGQESISAIKRLQAENNLECDGIAGADTYYILGLQSVG